MSERVVDAFEFIDVDIMNCQLLARSDPGQFTLESLVKQRAVRQIGQRIIVRKMYDPLLGAAALGNILVGSNPSAGGHRLVDDQYRTPIGSLGDVVNGFSERNAAQNRGTIFVNVAVERSGFLPVKHKIAKA